MGAAQIYRRASRPSSHPLPRRIKRSLAAAPRCHRANASTSPKSFVGTPLKIDVADGIVARFHHAPKLLLARLEFCLGLGLLARQAFFALFARLFELRKRLTTPFVFGVLDLIAQFLLLSLELLSELLPVSSVVLPELLEVPWSPALSLSLSAVVPISSVPASESPRLSLLLSSPQAVARERAVRTGSRRVRILAGYHDGDGEFQATTAQALENDHAKVTRPTSASAGTGRGVLTPALSQHPPPRVVG